MSTAPAPPAAQVLSGLRGHADYLSWPLLCNPQLPIPQRARPDKDIIRDRWVGIETRIRQHLRKVTGEFLLTEPEWTAFRCAARDAHLSQFMLKFPVGGTIKCCGPPGGNRCIAPGHPDGVEAPLLPGPVMKVETFGGRGGRYNKLTVLHLDHQPGLCTHTLPLWRHAIIQLAERRFAGTGPSWAAGLDAQRLMHLCFSTTVNVACGWPAVLNFRCGSERCGVRDDGTGKLRRVRLYPCHPPMDEQKKRDGVRYMPAASSL